MREEFAGFRKALVWWAVFAPMVLFVVLLNVLQTPLPIEDDYDAMLRFALRWTTTPGWFHKAGLVIAWQHNEYKLILQHAILGVELNLSGTIHFAWWMWTGNLLLLACLVPLWVSFLPQEGLYRRLLLFAPAVWILVNLCYAETLDWALSGMQEVAVVFLGVLCLFCALRVEARWNVAACGLALLACCTYANAFMLAPLGIPLFLKRKRGMFALWVFSFALALVLYLYHYQFLPHPRATFLSYGAYFVILVGSALSLHNVVLVPAAAGLLMLAGALVLARRGFEARHNLYGGLLVWLLGTFLLTAYGRAAFGIQLAQSSRYRIYSVFILASLYLLAVSAGQHRVPEFVARYLKWVYAVAILFGLFADSQGYKLLRHRQQALRYGMHHYQQSGGVDSPLVYSPHPSAVMVRPEAERRFRDTLTEVQQRGIYRIPAVY